MGQSAVYFFCGHAFDEDSCARNAGTGTFVCSICQTDPRKQHIRRTTPTQEVRLCIVPPERSRRTFTRNVPPDRP